MAVREILHIAAMSTILTGTTHRPIASAVEITKLLKDPINYYTTVELACSEGFPVQEHKIYTKDGYGLMVHRLPSRRILPPIPRKPFQYHKLHLNHHPDFDSCVMAGLKMNSTGFPIVFVHGVLLTTDGFLLQGGDKDLAFLMADLGYDVWMPNLRGNFYSKNHKWMKATQREFWDFSFHDHALYDLTAVIDYVLQVTQRPKVGYIGYSMGTTSFFVLASALPEYNEKIIGFAGLAPVAFSKYEYMDETRKPQFDLIFDLLDKLEQSGKVQEVFPRTPEIVKLGETICSAGSPVQHKCYAFYTVFLGYPSNIITREVLERYSTHFPAGTSLKNFIHYKQNMLRNSFKYFDYGSAKNLQMYGSAIPPDYPLWNITTPIALFYTPEDFFYDEKDLEDLVELVPNVVKIRFKPKLNHGDFIFADNAKDILYPQVISFFAKLIDQEKLQTRRK